MLGRKNENRATLKGVGGRTKNPPLSTKGVTSSKTHAEKVTETIGMKTPHRKPVKRGNFGPRSGVGKDLYTGEVTKREKREAEEKKGRSRPFAEKSWKGKESKKQRSKAGALAATARL